MQSTIPQVWVWANPQVWLACDHSYSLTHAQMRQKQRLKRLKQIPLAATVTKKVLQRKHGAA
jgi:hypothetical protein